jgi:hypothetical protein
MSQGGTQERDRKREWVGGLGEKEHEGGLLVLQMSVAREGWDLW